MRYETLKGVLKFAACGHVVAAVGDWVYFDGDRRGPMVSTINDAMRLGYLIVDPLGRVNLTEAGKRRLDGDGDRVTRVTVNVPTEHEQALRETIARFVASL